MINVGRVGTAATVIHQSINENGMTASPTLRQRLLSDAVRFIRVAMKTPGVTRVALLGSIMTAKQNPKDIDLLVTITDHADLAPLAVAGRRIKGQAQSYCAGADIFLANTAGQYIGRICQWKVCRFGVRVRCNARHCGTREFLHDDLDDVCLDAQLIQHPPLELWPNVVARVEVPEDVRRIVVAEFDATCRS